MSHHSPAVSIDQITDPTAVGESIEVIAQDAVQLGGARLRARRVTVRLDSSLVVYHSTNLAIRTRTVLKNGLVAFVAFGPRAVGTVNGLPVGPDRVLVSASGVEAKFVVSAGYESLSFLVPPEDLHAHLRGRHQEKDFQSPTGVELLQASVPAASGLYDWGRRLSDAAEREPALFDAATVRSAAQIEMMEMLLATIGSAIEPQAGPGDLTRQAHSQVVRTAEDYALAHAAEHLYVTDLCQAAGVSERTLQYAFREVLGMTPIAYLTRLRLHRVRQALRIETPQSTSVTAEAMKWGFWHFGDFSRAYKNCFGELPSETLRRNPREEPTG